MKKVTLFVALALSLLAVTPVFARGGRGGCRGGSCRVKAVRVRCTTCAPVVVTCKTCAPVVVTCTTCAR